MGAASFAAAMSAPERKPFFHRRWREGEPLPTADTMRRPSAEDDPVENTVRAVLDPWRRWHHRHDGGGR